MTSFLPRLPKLTLGLAVGLLVSLFITASAQAQLLFGSGGTGGSGVWDVGNTTNWYNGAIDVVWSNASAAVFEDTAGTVTISNGESIQTDSLTFSVSNYEIADSGGTLDDAGGTLSFASNSGGNFDVDTTISATIAGTGAWEFNFDSGNSPDQGNFVLSGANTRMGDLTLNSPTNDKFNSRTVLRINNSAALGVSSNTITLNSKTILAANTDLTLNHTVAFSDGSLGADAGITLTVDDASLLTGGTRTLGGNFNQGTVLFTDVATAFTSGTTQLTEDVTLEVNDAAALGDSSTDVSFNGGNARLLVTGTSTYSGTIEAERRAGDQSTIEVSSGATFTQTGDIVKQLGGGSPAQQEGLVVKQGVGTLFIDRASGISLDPQGGTGGIRVDAGTLRVANTSGSATGNGYTRIMSGATLETVDGSIIDPNDVTGSDDDTVLILGNLAPGVTIGTLTIGNSTDNDDVLQIAGNDGTSDFGGSLTIDMDGTTNDRVDVYGEIVLNLGLDSELVLENFGSGAQDAFTYVFASYSVLTGTFDTITNNTGLALDSSFGTGGIDYDYLGGNEIAVQFVPEPSTAMLVLLAGFCGLARRRRPNR